MVLRFCLRNLCLSVTMRNNVFVVSLPLVLDRVPKTHAISYVIRVIRASYTELQNPLEFPQRQDSLWF